MSYLVSESGAFLVSEGGAYFLTEDTRIPTMTDVMAACQELFQGIVVQRTLIDAATTYWIGKGAPLDSNDVTPILTAANVLNEDQTLAAYVPSTQLDYPTTLPSYPTGLPRFPDSNPAPDGWSVGIGGKVVFG